MIAFDDSGQVVAVTDFKYPSDEPELHAENAAEDALDVLRAGLLLALEQGHADGTRVRCVALARLLGLYASDTSAAKRTRVCRTSLVRTISQMRSLLQAHKRKTPHER